MATANRLLAPFIVGLIIFGSPAVLSAQLSKRDRSAHASSDLSDALPPEEWKRVDAAVDRALAWMALHQNSDGSFPTLPQGQPAVTSLCTLSFLSCGHQPESSKYQKQLNHAIDFVLGCQQPSGLFTFEQPQNGHVHQGASHTATYNHAIAGLMLCEAYGQVDKTRSEKIAKAVEKALKMTAHIQVEPTKANAVDNGGWRYLYRPGSFTPSDSDLSVTGWQLMFLRSAKNAGFDVPDAMVTDAIKYVERCFDERQGGFVYGLVGNDRHITRGTMGAGALSLALGGKHQTAMARRIGDWLLQHPFDTYGQTMHGEDRFHYSAYYCNHAMAQLGGDYWRRFFPVVEKTLVNAQSADGSWATEIGRDDAIYGPTYPTALSVLTLTPAYQMLPIYQR